VVFNCLIICDLFLSFIYILYISLWITLIIHPIQPKLKINYIYTLKKKWWMIKYQTLNLLTNPETTHSLYLVIIKLNCNYRVKIIILWYIIFLITIDSEKGSEDKAPTGYFLGKLLPEPQSLIASQNVWTLVLRQFRSIGRYLLPIIVSYTNTEKRTRRNTILFEMYRVMQK